MAGKIRCEYVTSVVGGQGLEIKYSTYAAALKDVRADVKQWGDAHRIVTRCSRVVRTKTTRCAWKGGKVVCTGGGPQGRRKRSR